MSAWLLGVLKHGYFICTSCWWRGQQCVHCIAVNKPYDLDYNPLALGSPKPDTTLPGVAWSAEERGKCWGEGKDQLPWPSCNWDIISLLSKNSTLLAHVHYLVCTRCSGFFSTLLLFIWVAPIMSWCLGLFLPRCGTLHFPLLNFMRFQPAHFSTCPGVSGWQHNPFVY